jgi:glutathione synthase/RimK-type ligase-like ATP-grasp enzyme
MMERVIAIATFSGMPDSDDDWPALRAALRDAGVEGEAVSWDAAGVDWGAYDLVVVRSTWDYTERLAEFLAWAGSVPRLLNPAAVIGWNTDKRYLAELADAGVPVVPTLWNPLDLPAGEGWERFVIKPTVSAGARNTAVWGPGEEEEARAHLQALADRGRTVMVQPYLSGVDTSGETALIFIDGEFSHAARKPAILSKGSGLHASPVLNVRAREKVIPVAPSTAELAVAELALASAPRRGDLLYARVDLIPGPDGEPVVLELELTEPSLFLSHDQGAPARMAAAIKSRL